MIFSTKLSVNYENIQKNKRAIIVDNFYKDPDAVREYALQQEFFEEMLLQDVEQINNSYFLDFVTVFNQLLDQELQSGKSMA